MLGDRILKRRKARAPGLPELVAEIGEQREAARDLVERFEREAGAARAAVRATARAREERDEYRRVLAAAIGSERRQVARVEALEQDRLRLEEAAVAAAREVGAVEADRDALHARLDRLDGSLAAERARRERELADAADRAWSEREAARQELVQLAGRVAQDPAEVARQVRIAVEDVLAARLPRGAGWGVAGDAASDELRSVHALRARLSIALAVAATLVGVALAPAAVLSTMDAERAAYVHLTTHLTPGQLVLATIAAFAAAVALLSLGRRDLARAAPAGADAAGGEAPVDPGEPEPGTGSERASGAASTGRLAEGAGA